MPPPTYLLSLAALDDILEVALPIIFMILWAVGQLLARKKQARKRGQLQEGGRKRRPPRPVAPPLEAPQGGVRGQDAGEPIGLDGALRKEVDEFLRRARGEQVRNEPPQRLETPRKKSPRRERTRLEGKTTTGRKATAPRRAREEHEPLRPLTPQAAEQRSGLSTIASIPATISHGGLSATAAQAEQPASNLRNQSVTEHVASHIDRGRQAIGQHAERLADSLEQTDERIQQRIEQKFEHQVGRLQHQEAVGAVQKMVLAEEIADLLRSPEGMRQLIIANEILRRPLP